MREKDGGEGKRTRERNRRGKEIAAGSRRMETNIVHIYIYAEKSFRDSSRRGKKKGTSLPSSSK